MQLPVSPDRLSRRSVLALAGASLGACSLPQSPDDSTGQVNAEQPSSAPCWASLAPLPFAVQEIYPIGHRQRIHLAGGLLGRDERVVGVSDRHIAYDPATGATQTLSPLPSPRHHPQLVSLADQLYCLGGFRTLANMVNWIMTDETLRYDDKADAWRPLASAPEPHAETVAAILNNQIHIVGGRRNTGADNMSYRDHTDSDSHLVFDPAGNTWRRAAPASMVRNSATGAVIDGLWHVLGGRTVTGGPMDAHEVYDPKEDRWQTAAPLPAGIGAGGNAAGIIDGKVYAFGGEVFGADGGSVHAEVCCYDPVSDAWEIVGEMPTPRHGLGGVTLNNAVYALGGATRPSGNGTTGAVERLSAMCS